MSAFAFLLLHALIAAPCTDQGSYERQRKTTEEEAGAQGTRLRHARIDMSHSKHALRWAGHLEGGNALEAGLLVLLLHDDERAPVFVENKRHSGGRSMRAGRAGQRMGSGRGFSREWKRLPCVLLLRKMSDWRVEGRGTVCDRLRFSVWRQVAVVWVQFSLQLAAGIIVAWTWVVGAQTRDGAFAGGEPGRADNSGVAAVRGRFLLRCAPLPLPVGNGDHAQARGRARCWWHAARQTAARAV